jgi:hypothetical protein
VRLCVLNATAFIEESPATPDNYKERDVKTSTKVRAAVIFSRSSISNCFANIMMWRFSHLRCKKTVIIFCSYFVVY